MPFLITHRMVPISGDGGTGKELVAKAIHVSGIYIKPPFVSINCRRVTRNPTGKRAFWLIPKGPSLGGPPSTEKGLFENSDKGPDFPG